MTTPIKIVDFQKIKNIQPEYGNEFGEYDPNTDTIKIDVRCGAKRIPSKKEVLLHEGAHRWLHKKNLSSWLTDDQEETFCDLMAIAGYSRKGLYGIERHIHKKLFKPKTSRKAAVIAILKELNIKNIKPFMEAL